MIKDHSAEDEVKSKSQIKREMQALQDLGVALVKLSPKQLEHIPLDDNLRQAIETAAKIKQREAHRRQLQFIGKLMRQADSESILAAYEQLDLQHKHNVKAHHLVEQWRDRLLNKGPDEIEAFMRDYPCADRQQLRTLVRESAKENAQGKPPTQARKLFKYLREILLN